MSKVRFFEIEILNERIMQLEHDINGSDLDIEIIRDQLSKLASIVGGVIATLTD